MADYQSAQVPPKRINTDYPVCVQSSPLKKPKANEYSRSSTQTRTFFDTHSGYWTEAQWWRVPL